MATLFPHEVTPEDVPSIGGLVYLPRFLDQSEEDRLIQAIEALPWDTTWQRRRQLYGGAYGKGDAAADIPAWGHELAKRIFDAGLAREPFNHMLVNEYLPGQGIALHRDYQPFGRTVASLSLVSAYVMDFHNPQENRKQSLLLEPRSLLVLSDEARYVWQHGIVPRKTDVWHGVRFTRARRLSVTFRARKP
jgi:alkylated DNA repair dioxygenase AlkB